MPFNDFLYFVSVYYLLRKDQFSEYRLRGVATHTPSARPER